MEEVQEASPNELGTNRTSPKQTSEDDNYMELYVEKEIKDKFNPLEEQLQQRSDEIVKLMEKMGQMDEQIRKIDKHYDGVSRAILSKQGVMLKEINEYHILKEY